MKMKGAWEKNVGLGSFPYRVHAVESAHGGRRVTGEYASLNSATRISHDSSRSTVGITIFVLILCHLALQFVGPYREIVVSESSRRTDTGNTSRSGASMEPLRSAINFRTLTLCYVR